MRKVLAVIVAAILLLGFAGCEMLSANEPKNEPVVLSVNGAQNTGGAVAEEETFNPAAYNTWKQYILELFSGYTIEIDDSKAYAYEIHFSNIEDYGDWLEKWAEVIENMAVYNANGMNEIRSMDIDGGSARLYFNAVVGEDDVEIETWLIVVGGKKYDTEFKYLSLLIEYDMYYVKDLNSIYGPTFEEVLEARGDTTESPAAE